MLVRSRRNAASAQIRFLVRPSFAQGNGGTAHRQSSAEKARDQGETSERNHVVGIWDDVLRSNLQGKPNARQQSINDILQAAFQILTYEKVSSLDGLQPQSLMESRPQGRNS